MVRSYDRSTPSGTGTLTQEGAPQVKYVHVHDAWHTCLRKPNQEVVQHTPSTSENLCTSSHLKTTDKTMWVTWNTTADIAACQTYVAYNMT